MNRLPRIAAAVILLVGSLQMVADLAGWTKLKGLAAATMISPAPKVFSAHQGYETFSTAFFLELTDSSGAVRSERVSSQRYAGVLGPYNRRNVYGAALAYGPVLPPELRDPVMRYALCGERPLLRELGLDPAAVRDVRVRFVTRDGKTIVIPAGCP